MKLGLRRLKVIKSNCAEKFLKGIPNFNRLFFISPMIGTNQPLADRMRPKDLDGYFGQEHLVGENAILRQSIESGVLPSFLYGGHRALEKQPWQGL